LALIADYHEENVDDVIMRDAADGAGSAIKIPAYLVSHDHAKLITETI